ncbi:hypothetical protein RF11_04886 [Thelohanellus kitauei]|uniref:Uncharacterized protein n=1 Tax=Thelohanellus kitauei TaxID=669202 RepID=A0A0C2N121_THEKT|nr:hypothetical protein RF11_04886 [Thelohanellus kitauei]
MDIDVFDNSQTDDSTHILHSITLSAFKYKFLGYDKSKQYLKALLYDKNWKNITIRFKIRDVLNGTTEYSFIRVINHIPYYLQPENDFIFTNLRVGPLTGSSMCIYNRNYLIDSTNAIALLPYNITFKEPLTNKKPSQMMLHKYGNLTGDHVISIPYLCPRFDKNIHELALRDYSIFTDDL